MTPSYPPRSPLYLSSIFNGYKGQTSRFCLRESADARFQGVEKFSQSGDDLMQDVSIQHSCFSPPLAVSIISTCPDEPSLAMAVLRKSDGGHSLPCHPVNLRPGP